MPSLPRKTKKPSLGSHRRELPQTQEPIPLHIEKHIERPSYSQQPNTPAPSRIIVIDLVGD
jgi:hypothetical protein